MTMCASNGVRGQGVLSHQAWLFSDDAEPERGIRRFVEEGLQAGEPALVMAPASRLEALCAGLGGARDRASLQDMAHVGLNPARIIPVLLDWVARHTSDVRIVTEPVWPDRSHAELVEVMRHEALVETALGSARATLRCVYPDAALPAWARASLERSHHSLQRPDGSVPQRLSESDGTGDVLGRDLSLEPPSEPVEELTVTLDLHRLREQVEASEAASALPRARCEEFVTALNEAASNALQYGRPPRALRLWRDDSEVVGEVTGRGRIADPMAGRRRPPPSAVGGRGLWLVNQLCDLVELRSCRSRTTVRMHKRCS